MSIATKLKDLRLRNGKSLQAVADAVGASKAHIWEVETGKSPRPSLDLVRRLADYYRVSLASLVGEDPNLPSEEDEELLVMWRDLKDLPKEEREYVAMLIQTMRERRKKVRQDAD